MPPPRPGLITSHGGGCVAVDSHATRAHTQEPTQINRQKRAQCLFSLYKLRCSEGGTEAPPSPHCNYQHATLGGQYVITHQI